MIVLGKNVKIYIGDVLVAGAKSCTFRLSQGFIDVSSPASGRFLEKVPTNVAWDMSVSGLVANVGSPIDSLTDLLLAGTQVLLEFNDGANKPRIGLAYVKQCDRSGNVGAFATYSASFEGSGEFVDVSKYLCFTAQRDNSTVGYTITGTVNKDIYTSTDGINWTSWDGMAIVLNNGESIYIWNKVGSLSTSDSNYLQFTMSGSIAASGDISSMLNWAVLGSYCFYRLFRYCTSLVTAPELPATTLANYCYHSMFKGCTSLTTAPSLPATTLANSCYYSMFQGCTSLNHIKLSYTDSFSNIYFQYWVSGVASNGTFYYNGSDTTRGESAIPNGWTVQGF